MFEVVGKRINTSRKLVQAAVAKRDTEYIIDDVKKQMEAGAIRTADMLLGHDDFCMNYLKGVRSGIIES